MNRSRGSWSTRFGFYMVAIGSSFGLGNLWRFPYMAGDNGGGAFVLLYIFFVIIIGVPLLIAELMLGKLSRQSAVGSIEFAMASQNSALHRPSLARGGWKSWKKFDARWIGRFAILANFILLSYYAVVSGWVAYYGYTLTLKVVGLSRSEPYQMYRTLMGSGWLQFGLSLVHMSLAGFIVAKGIRQGVERAIGIVMSVFMLLVVILIVQSLSLSGTPDALRFLFYPDFSGFKISSWTHVIGHVCFTLSLGIGAMIVFGSYLNEEMHTPTEAVRVALLDTLMSLLAGLLIFPIVFSNGGLAEGGPGLLFQSLPVLFQRIGMGPLFGAMFFVCLYCAALGATIGLLESGVSNLVDRKKITRRRATLLVCAVVVMGSLFPSLSTTAFRGVQYQGMGLLELLDSLIISWMLPLSSLGVCLVVGYKLDRRIMAREFISVESQGLARLYRNWLFVLRWVAPAVILSALLLNILGSFK